VTDTPDAPRGPAASGRAHPTDMPELPGVTHAFVTLSTGLRMHVAEAGNPDAPTVLLLHGFPQHWWEWRKVIPPLAEHYRVVAPDLRGAGWTDAPADGYTVGDVSMGGADAGVRPGMLDVYDGQADDLAGHIIDGAAHFLADDRPDAVVTHALTLFGRVL
jgi:hypothetical protein